MRVITGLMLVASLALGGAASVHAADPTGGEPLQLPLDGDSTAPNWRTPPSAQDLEREYPPLAALLQVPGHATIKCQAEVDGRVDACHVVSETPAGMGFGAAAVRSAAYFSMKPATLDGKPVPGDVTIPLTFVLNSQGPPAPTPIPAPTSPGALDAARQVVALQNLPARMQAQWRPWMEQMNARLVLENQTQPGEKVLDAVHQGMNEAIAEQADTEARQLAGRMSEADLRAAAAYMSSPAGKAWLATTAELDPVMTKDWMPRLSRAVRSHLCAPANCAPGAAVAPGASASR